MATTVKTADLTGSALDWAVAMAMGWIEIQITEYEQEGMLEEVFFRPAKYFGEHHICGSGERFKPSTDWDQGGMIIDSIDGLLMKRWVDAKSKCQAHIDDMNGSAVGFGPTVLVAVMRCFVSHKLGETVNVPEGLA